VPSIGGGVIVIHAHACRVIVIVNPHALSEPSSDAVASVVHLAVVYGGSDDYADRRRIMIEASRSDPTVLEKPRIIEGDLVGTPLRLLYVPYSGEAGLTVVHFSAQPKPFWSVSRFVSRM